MAGHVEWRFEGTFLNICRKTEYSEQGVSRGPNDHCEWSYKGDTLNVFRNESFVDSAVSSHDAASAAPSATSKDSAADYLSKHQIKDVVEDAINLILASRPADPIAAIAEALLSKKSGAAVESSSAAAPAEPVVDVTALENEIKNLGDKIRSMKEAIKVNPAAHSKESLDAEVAALKALKDKIKSASKDGDGKDAGKKASKDDKASNKFLISVEPVTGARDFYPEDMRVRNWLFGTFREVARLFAFQEYDAPVLEHEDLYKRKAGEEITQQMYNFQDKGGFAVSLRPEMTPSLARMVLGRTSESGDTKMLLPVKWFSIPQCWRFENTQRGRKREHYQWNMDIVGVKGVSAEVELLAAITSFFAKVGLSSKDVGIKVNSRKVMGSILKAKGISDAQFAPVCVVVDKLDKIGADAVKQELTCTLGVATATADAIIATMSARSVEELRGIAKEADEEGLLELEELFVQAKAYGFGDYLLFDASVVRGLAYYTGVVFECFDRAGELRAICGGGRYDRLLSLYGSRQEVPCVGFGFGDCVIMELLAIKRLVPPLPQLTDFVVAAFSKEMQDKAVQVAALLRGAGATVDMQGEVKRKVGQTFDYANRIGARMVALVAPDEWDKGLVRIKNLRLEDKEANQKDVPLTDLAATWSTLWPI